MASVHDAITFCLKLEDAEMSGVVTDRKYDHGGRTRWGLAERWHPELTQIGYYDKMSREDSLDWAMCVYEGAYAKPLAIEQIVDQRVANSMLSMGIVSGTHPAALLLQDALCVIGSKVGLDGAIGQETIDAANRADAAQLLEAYITQQKDRFDRIMRRDPTQKVNYDGWCNRADKARQLSIA
jgi:lysozyme family protein